MQCIMKKKYTYLARGILDFCKQKFERPLLCNPWTLYSIYTQCYEMRTLPSTLWMFCNTPRSLCNTARKLRNTRDIAQHTQDVAQPTWDIVQHIWVIAQHAQEIAQHPGHCATYPGYCVTHLGPSCDDADISFLI